VTTLPFDLTDFFAPVQANIASYRTAMGLPQITGPDGVNSGTLSIGEEYLKFQLAPPGIIIVPMGGHLRNYLDSGVQTSIAPILPKQYWTDEMAFEAYCWGDEDPAGAPPAGSQLYSYNSAIELRRELAVALAQIGGIPEAQFGRYRWTPESGDTNRIGRVLTLEFALWSPVNDTIIGPNVIVPFATDSSSGVQVDAAIVATSPDGSSTLQVGTIIAPPA
jgi:hypothetical protein